MGHFLCSSHILLLSRSGTAATAMTGPVAIAIIIVGIAIP